MCTYRTADCDTTKNIFIYCYGMYTHRVPARRVFRINLGRRTRIDYNNMFFLNIEYIIYEPTRIDCII